MTALVEVTEYTGNDSLQLGNADIDCTREPASPDSARATPPGHEHLIGVDPLPKAGAWLTERRADLLFLALAAVGVYLGVLA